MCQAPFWVLAVIGRTGDKKRVPLHRLSYQGGGSSYASEEEKGRRAGIGAGVDELFLDMARHYVFLAL